MRTSGKKEKMNYENKKKISKNWEKGLASNRGAHENILGVTDKRLKKIKAAKKWEILETALKLEKGLGANNWVSVWKK